MATPERATRAVPAWFTTAAQQVEVPSKVREIKVVRNRGCAGESELAACYWNGEDEVYVAVEKNIVAINVEDDVIGRNRILAWRSEGMAVGGESLLVGRGYRMEVGQLGA